MTTKQMWIIGGVIVVVGLIVGLVVHFSLQNASATAAQNLNTKDLGTGLGQGIVTSLFTDAQAVLNGQPLQGSGNK